MSTTEITDVLVLAAVDRAVRHHWTGTPRAAPVRAIYEHLGVSSRSRAGRHLRAQLEALDGSALLRGKRRGVETWELTQAGKRRIRRLRANGKLPELPESPQHRVWREARELAEQRIEGFWMALLAEVERAHDLMGSPQVPGRPPSDVLFELGERLHQASKRLASATYCICEWREPSDDRADVDSYSDPSDRAFDPKERAKRHARRAGRRNTRLWDSDLQLAYLGQAIRQERQRHDMSPAELASKAGIGKRLVARLEAGEADPDYVQFLALARALNLRPSALIGRAREAEEGWRDVDDDPHTSADND
jgi:ribosome-binding protein aMBF1 (putative translation factor)